MLLAKFEVHCNSAATEEQMAKIMEVVEDIDLVSIVKNMLPEDLAALIV